MGERHFFANLVGPWTKKGWISGPWAKKVENPCSRSNLVSGNESRGCISITFTSLRVLMAEVCASLKWNFVSIACWPSGSRRRYHSDHNQKVVHLPPPSSRMIASLDKTPYDAYLFLAELKQEPIIWTRLQATTGYLVNWRAPMPIPSKHLAAVALPWQK